MSNDCICNHIHNAINVANITQFIFHASFFKLICSKLDINWTFASQVPVKFFVLPKLPKVQREFIHTQHLHVVASSIVHVVASSIAKLPDDAFVSAATAGACSMVNLVRLFMKPHLLALL